LLLQRKIILFFYIDIFIFMLKYASVKEELSTLLSIPDQKRTSGPIQLFGFPYQWQVRLTSEHGLDMEGRPIRPNRPPSCQA